MITKRAERLRRIVQTLAHSDKVHLTEMSRLLEVSEMTIRRDLQSPDSYPYKLELYGGYLRKLINPTAENTPSVVQHIFTERTTNIDNYKPEYLSLIEEGDTVFLDWGGESIKIADSVDKEVSFTAVTNSVEVWHVLKDKPNCELIMIGGKYNAATMSFDGSIQGECGHMIFTKAFLTVQGLHDHFGVMSEHELQAAQYQEVTNACVKNYVIIDNDSWGKTSKYRVCEATRVGGIICIDSPDESLKSYAKQQDVAMIV